ncbi:hypothetical protein MA16_Dca021674 [Dendrobium catenatum]|uniref:Uncharacterized protein n=1 Tax=Dendrobium catenatum TaxID=906689 RepID=A0A2I0V765_9ASPA|nr:hypothetical protein MA16_Dca021674 [Dendrobium catenatum]
MDRLIPSEGNSIDSIQNDLYKLQMKMHICTEQYMRKKRCLHDQFMQEREEILKTYAAKIQELDAPSFHQEKPKTSLSGDESFQPGKNLMFFPPSFPLPLALQFPHLAPLPVAGSFPPWLPVLVPWVARSCLLWLSF